MKKKSSGKLPISDWKSSDRPREKYMEKGMASLTNAELIAILLRSGNTDESAVELAIRLLHLNENKLENLAKMTLKELLKINGIGEAKAISIITAFELGQRRRAESVNKQHQIKCASDVLEIMQDKIAHISHEEFWVIFLNQSSKVLAVKNFSKGGITSTEVDVRLVAKTALELLATSVIICHNHPSGELSPSPSDIQLTHNFKDALALLNIRVVDHVILHGDDCFSFVQKGIMA
ncbi:DNA repair protein RadC [Bacteroidales bacterium OttesenSCG-928-B11]|nr:DNA repair protein RadC [Bacteroidales bacterium OttesenSCG-928-C03]MDL2311868.1 DNA repair protein RadC [Bacteroidales bacterium OttesenSCG-928-B11]MDL2326175.1 DNA repair protein RadC [Bacteroidales bacterium OttesenSCG-928-A14]